MYSTAVYDARVAYSAPYLSTVNSTFNAKAPTQAVVTEASNLVNTVSSIISNYGTAQGKLQYGHYITYQVPIIYYNATTPYLPYAINSITVNNTASMFSTRSVMVFASAAGNLGIANANPWTLIGSYSGTSFTSLSVGY